MLPASGCKHAATTRLYNAGSASVTARCKPICVVALPWNPSTRISPSSCRYSGTEGCEFTSLIGSFRFGHGMGAYSSPLKSRQPSPLHTLPHHSCSTTPPRSCLAMHARTGAWALIVEPFHKSHRHPCLQGLSVSFSYRFISARDLREPWLGS
jgi:hypothetical protein